MAETFTPPIKPSIGMTDKPELKLLKAEFGDGYTQTTVDGINSIRRVISLGWQYLGKAEADSIVNFMRARGGADPFWWQVPGEAAPVAWTCDDWSREYGATHHSINAVFRQYFGAVS